MFRKTTLPNLALSHPITIEIPSFNIKLRILKSLDLLTWVLKWKNSTFFSVTYCKPTGLVTFRSRAKGTKSINKLLPSSKNIFKHFTKEYLIYLMVRKKSIIAL